MKYLLNGTKTQHPNFAKASTSSMILCPVQKWCNNEVVPNSMIYFECGTSSLLHCNRFWLRKFSFNMVSLMTQSQFLTHTQNPGIWVFNKCTDLISFHFDWSKTDGRWCEKLNFFLGVPQFHHHVISHVLPLLCAASCVGHAGPTWWPKTLHWHLIRSKGNVCHFLPWMQSLAAMGPMQKQTSEGGFC